MGSKLMEWIRPFTPTATGARSLNSQEVQRRQVTSTVHDIIRIGITCLELRQMGNRLADGRERFGFQLFM